MGPGLVSLEMLFEALQSELVKSKFHTLSAKVLKIPEFSLAIRDELNMLHWFCYDLTSELVKIIPLIKLV